MATAANNFTTNLGLGVLPEIDALKDNALYNELTRLRSAIRTLAFQLDQYTFGGDVSTVLAAYAKLTGGNAFTGTQSITFHTLTDSPTITIDGSVSNNLKVTLSGNRTLALTDMQDGALYSLWVYQDGVGGHTLTFPGGTTPVIAAGANALTRFLMQYNSAEAVLACTQLTTFF